MIAIEFSDNMFVLDAQVRATISAFKDGIGECKGFGCHALSPSKTFCCTRDSNHKGLHIASDGVQVVATWGEGVER